MTYTPVNPSFTTSKWGLRGSKLYRHVFVMDPQTQQNDPVCTKGFVLFLFPHRIYVLDICRKCLAEVIMINVQ